jgi:Nucleotide modification associated domain 2
LATLFSYVVDHDYGVSPNPESGYCTLVHCKFQRRGSKRKNIVESVRVGDWIVGTGGRSKESSGPGTLLYFMRVDEILPFRQFLSDKRFLGRADRVDRGEGNRFALISRHYFYFGKSARNVSALPKQLAKDLEKTGPGYRHDYPADKLIRLAKWLERNYEVGIHGDPCDSRANTLQPRLRAKSSQ